MTISSTRFRHRNIHEATWLSPDGKTRKQIDHFVIDGGHASSALDVLALRGPNKDSDHYLVAAKVRTRLSAAKRISKSRKNFNVNKVNSQTADVYFTKLSQLLLAKDHPTYDVKA